LYTTTFEEVYDVTRKTPVFCVVLITGLMLLVVPAALAGKGGNGAGGATGASIAFAPTTVVVGQQYQVNGTGFKPDTWVTVGAHYADTTWWNSAKTDAQGRLSLAFTATSAGNIYHEAQQLGNNDRLRLVASATLTVGP
jgi:hypothetical protein